MRITILLAMFALASGGKPNGTSNASTFTVGTVLFSPSDVNRECWSTDDAALLTTRMLMQNLMPRTSALKVDDDRFVGDIIEYFRILLEVIRSTTSGKTKHIVLLALTDTLGGYMKHLIIPLSKYAYYAGNVDYASIIKLYQLFDELKNYLRTNGNGWAKPWKRAGKHVQAKVMNLQSPAPTSDPCKGIIYYKHSVQPSPEQTKKAGEGGEAPKTCGMEVPLPFFDSKSHPTAIAVPFKTFGLRNLESRVSAYILVKFFVAVSKCMASRNVADAEVEKFNYNLYTFVMGKVMPHLGEDKFYAGFGGVLRVLETIKDYASKRGKNLGGMNLDQEDREPYPELADEEGGMEGMGEGGKAGGGGGGSESSKKSKNNLILLAALATIIIWFCLGAAFVCCRIRVSKLKKEERLKALESLDPDRSQPAPSDDDDDDMCKQGDCPAFNNSSRSGTTPDTSRTKNDNEKMKWTAKSTTPTNTTEGESDTNSKYTNNNQSKSQFQYRMQQQSSTISGPMMLTKQEQTDASLAELAVQSMHYYPPTYACHTSMTGKLKVDELKVDSHSSTDEYTSREEGVKRPYVFGYDFQTTSEDDTSPRETTDGENDMVGNMSK